jgi:hypothetical protein
MVSRLEDDTFCSPDFEPYSVWVCYDCTPFYLYFDVSNQYILCTGTKNIYNIVRVLENIENKLNTKAAVFWNEE